MSRALGAAFLSHQVVELERAVANNHANTPNSPRRGGGGGGMRGRGRGGGGANNSAKRGGHRSQTSDDASGEDSRMSLPVGTAIVVLDASVLVHAPGAVKRWCRDHIGPDLVVPLEVLNTLDLLKKGTSLLAQRARAASRLLESLVGSDTRLRVQRDEAFVPWDDIPIMSTSDSDSDDSLPPPEWLRRMLCCARWEAAHNSHAPTRPSATVLVAVAESGVPVDATTEFVPGRNDCRADGALIRVWVPRVSGLRLFAARPSAAGAGPGSKFDRLPADAYASLAAEMVPIVAPTTVPRARGKQLFDPKSDDAYSYADPLHPDSPRFSRTAPAPATVPLARKPGSSGTGARKRDEQPLLLPPPPPPQQQQSQQYHPVRVVRVLARGEKLDP
ncbi:hypothetical protein BKA62DRAFT_768845 [Auriculariales sp. MPI-PUGE-AT-0066]|nr:hypothetical protein BKA62DRAFT_768845 [Auriculariales sp. MPI-PUGE-AT-0066]